MASYVVVDEGTKHIVGGPYEWDGQAPWEPPDSGVLIPEYDALQAGYVYPYLPPGNVLDVQPPEDIPSE